MLSRVPAALSGWALPRGRVAFASCVIAGVHLRVRAGEILGAARARVQMVSDGRGAVSLPWTKTAAQKGAREHVAVDDPYVGVWLRRQ